MGRQRECFPDRHCICPPAVMLAPFHPLLPCMANLAPPCCHHPPVLEMVHLAEMLVHQRPATSEAPPPAVIVSGRIGIWCVSLGWLSTTSNPDQQNLQPNGPLSPLPGTWSAVTMTEAGKTKQLSASLPRSKALAPCSQFWRGAAVYANLFLGYTDYGVCNRTFWCWECWLSFYCLHFSHHCHRHYPTSSPVMGPLQIAASNSNSSTSWAVFNHRYQSMDCSITGGNDCGNCLSSWGDWSCTCEIGCSNCLPRWCKWRCTCAIGCSNCLSK